MAKASGPKQNLIEETENLKQKIRQLEQETASLRKANEQYRLLTENAREATSIIQDGVFQLVNHQVELLTGYSKEELLLQSSIDFIHPDDRARVLEQYDKRMRGELAPNSYEFRIITKDGSIKWVEIHATFVSWNSKPASLNFIIDITGRKNVEEKLHESQLIYQAIFETTGTTMLIVEEDMVISLANSRFEELTGYKREEVQGKKKWTDFVEKSDLESMIGKHRLRREKPEATDKVYEFRLVHKDGTLKDILLTVDLIPKTKKSVASLLEITEIKKSQAALKEKERKYREILENITDGYFEVDLRGNLTFFSNVLPAYTGYTSAELQGMNYREYIDRNYWEEVKAVLGELYAGDIPAKTANYEILKKNGTRADIETAFSIMRDEAGRPAGFRGIARDVSERRRMEERLQQASRDLQEIGFIVHKSPSIAFLWQNADNWPVEFVSDNINQFGYRPDDFTSGRIPYAQIIYPDDLERVGAEVAHYSGAGYEEFSQEYRVFTKTGAVRWIDDRTGIRRNAEGSITHFQGIITDITDRKLAEQALKRSEHLYRTIFENTGSATILVNEDTSMTLVNSEFEKLSGYSKDEVEGKKSWTEFIAPDDLERMVKQHYLRRKDENAALHKYEFKFVDRYNNIKDISLSIGMIPGTTQSIASLNDITSLKQTEKNLQDSRRRMTEIIEFFPLATLIIDKEGKVIAWNRAMEAIMGVKSEAMIGKGNYEYALPFYGERRPILIDFALHPDEETEKKYPAIRRNGDILQAEDYNYAPGRSSMHLSAVASVLRDDDGNIIAAIECVSDITERRKLEERLKRAEKMESLGTLAGGVAHDLNNVLGIMVGYSELMKEGLTEENRLHKYADSILQSSIRASAIIQDLLTLARRGVTVEETVNLNKVAAAYLKTPEFEKLRLYHPDVNIIYRPEDNLLNIKGSPIHLSKTIMNLVANAAEAISGRGEITISTENRYLDQPVRGYDEIQEGDYAVLVVADTGSGISDEDLDKIFEPFYTKKVMGRSGTGLGLSVVWGTVKDHRGYIDVKSEEGKGSIFSLYFPVSREAALETNERISPAVYNGRGELVLVVDDRKEQRDLAAILLERLGYRVMPAAGGEEAVEFVRNNAKPDLILLDMIMAPGIDGLETYRRILEINPGQKAVIVSGFSATDRVKKAQEMGAGEFVRKPYIMEKIGRAVRKELDRK